MSSTDINCFCGSEKKYAACCGRFHSGAEKAATAEQLMRSRYAAFCCKNADYLVATHHPSKRSPDDKAELENNFAAVNWIGLQILSTETGQAADNEGVVEFQARCVKDGTISSLNEASRFVKEEGEWFYLDGKPTLSASSQKLGRNDICFCGSGKKYKKCHGA